MLEKQNMKMYGNRPRPEVSVAAPPPRELAHRVPFIVWLTLGLFISLSIHRSVNEQLVLEKKMCTYLKQNRLAEQFLLCHISGEHHNT